jgi:hypothetical protein
MMAAAWAAIGAIERGQRFMESRSCGVQRMTNKYYYVTHTPGSGFVATLTVAEIRARLAAGELQESLSATESDGRSFTQFQRDNGGGRWRTLAELLAEREAGAASATQPAGAAAIDAGAPAQVAAANPEALPSWRRQRLLSSCLLLACGAILGLLAGWSWGRRGDTWASLALPGSTWRLKNPGGDSFLEFREDGVLVEARSHGPGAWGRADLGKYTITSYDEISLEISTHPREPRVASGRFKVILAGDNLVLEKRSRSERIFLRRLTQASDEPRPQQVSHEELVRRSQEESRHQQIMQMLGQIATKK